MQSGSTFRIKGIVPIVPTPFHGDGEVDYDSLAGLIDFAAYSGACAVCLPAYASEFYKLTPDEHAEVIRTAIHAGRGKIPVIAQVNTPSLRQAVRGATFAEQAGADAVNVAVPRLFALNEADLFRYFDRVLGSVAIPLVIQDYNPAGGPSVSQNFIARLHRAHPHFRYIKLEEPMMAAKVNAILDATNDEVGVLEGWGGMYMMELIPAGICGVMPGLALADLLAQVFELCVQDRRAEAFDIFSGVLPQIVYSLQNMELFHHAEKLLLESRGLLPSATVREATLALASQDREHIDFLNAGVLSLLDRVGLARNPVPARQTA